MNILITGGAGYIGSHICYRLIDKGHKVSTIDNLSMGSKKLIPKEAHHLNCDISNFKVILPFLKKNKFNVVMHLAAFTSVADSLKNPQKYLENNFDKAKVFIDLCLENNLDKFIFSSTAAVYGNLNSFNNVSEKTKANPNNPYAESKFKLEQFFLKEVAKKNADCTILRYFNVAGADLKKRTGFISKSDNLIKLICEVATKKRSKLIVNGNDYQTKDGTPVRDFIHVSDIADIHIAVAESLTMSGESEIYNCGYGEGFSVMDVISAINSIIKFKLPIEIGPRRKSDIVYSVANNKKFLKKFNWKPKYNDLKVILESALEWEKHNQ